MNKYLITILLSPGFALAAEHGHPSIKDTYPYWINFIIFISVLTSLLIKPLKRFWNSRRELLDEGVNRGKKTLAAAEQELRLAQDRYRNITSEVESLKAQIHTESLKEAEKILSNAAEQAERIIANAGKSADAEKQAAVRAVQEDFADKVYEAARVKLQAEFSPEFDRGFREKAFKGVGALK